MILFFKFKKIHLLTAEINVFSMIKCIVFSNLNFIYCVNGNKTVQYIR